jgi:hypothetical protein
VTAPSWWQLVLLGLAVFRVTRLIGWDDLTILPRRWLTGMGDQEHHEWAHVIETAKEQGKSAWDLTVGDWFDFGLQEAPQLTTRTLIGPTDQPYAIYFRPPVTERRYYLSKLLRCPWCAGWWISLATWLAWEAWPHAVMVGAAPFAISAVVGLTAKNLDE